jgi:hypothetical protein
MKSALAIFGLLTASAAQADAPEHWLTMSQGSYHLNPQAGKRYNQSNPGFGFEWAFKNDWVRNTRWIGGRFYNSDWHYSNYAGVLATPFNWLEGEYKVQAGAVLGTINGYPTARNGGWLPMIAPLVQISYGPVGTNVYLIPPIKGVPATLGVQLKVGF